MTNWEALDGNSPEDLLMLPPDRFLNKVLAFMRSRMRDLDWRNFESRLHRPPPGVTPEVGPWSDQEMGAAFDAFSREFGS